MSENAGSIYSEVEIRLDKLQQDQNALIAQFQRFGKKLDQITDEAGKKVENNVKKPLINVQTAAIAASAAIAVGFSKIVKTFGETEQALSDLQAATKANAEEMLTLEKAAASAAQEIGATMTEAVRAETDLAKAGVSTADIVGGALVGALTLARAGTMDVGEAAEIAAATMTQFGKSGSDVTHIADLLAAGAGKAQGEVSDLSQALKQSGLVAAQTGVSLESTIGTLAAFASAGLMGSDAGTSFRTMLLRLTPQSKEAADEMERLGIKAFDSQGQFIGLERYAQLLQDRLSGLTVEQRNAALATVFGSDSIRAANILYTQGGKGIAEWTAKVNDSGYAAEVARIKMDNFNGDVTKLNASLSTASNTIGNSLNPVLRGATQAATAVVDWFGKLDSGLVALLSTVGLVAGGVFGLGGALGALGVSVSVLFGPIGIAVTGLAALAAGIATASAAWDQSKLKDGKSRFGALAAETGLAGKALDDFARKAIDAQRRLESLYGAQLKNFGPETFEELAKSMGLTNDQLAVITLQSDKAAESVKAVARGYIDTTAQAKRLSDAAIQAGKDMQEYWSKRYPDAAKKGQQATTDLSGTIKTLSDAIAYQNYLEARGLVSTEDALKAKIALREDEIAKIQEAGAKVGFLTADQQKEIVKLTGLNKENQASVDAIVKAREDEKKASDDALNAEKAARAQIDDLMTSEIDKIVQARDEKLKYAKTDEERVAIIADSVQKIGEIEDAAAAKTKALSDKEVADAQKATDDKIAAAKYFASETLSILSTLAQAIGSLFSSYYDEILSDLESTYERERELIENNGRTKKQALEEELATAISTGDQEAVAEAQKALDLYNLEAEYTRKKAKIEYDAAMAAWKIQVALATAAAAKGFAEAIPNPIAMAFAGAAGVIQVAAAIAAEPPKPKFATGGLVLPSGSEGRSVTVGDQGGGDILFGTGALGQPLMQGFADMVASAVVAAIPQAQGGGQSVTIPVYLDGKIIGQSTADLINGGKVAVKGLVR